MWDTIYTVVSGGIIVILASFMNAVMNNIYDESSVVAFLGLLLLMVIAFYVMGKIAPIVIKFFDEKNK